MKRIHWKLKAGVRFQILLKCISHSCHQCLKLSQINYQYVLNCWLNLILLNHGSHKNSYRQRNKCKMVFLYLWNECTKLSAAIGLWNVQLPRWLYETVSCYDENTKLSVVTIEWNYQLLWWKYETMGCNKWTKLSAAMMEIRNYRL